MNEQELQQVIESFAPASLQESWDNSGWNVNLHPENIRGVLVCLDVTPEAVEAARQAGCSVIVSHHPLLFRAVKRIDADREPGRCLSALLSAGISLYCAHTSADSTLGGINTWLAGAFGLVNARPLEPQDVRLCKLAVTVPEDDAPRIRQALSNAGAGSLGEYTDCTFSVTGTGTFRPSAAAHPAIGTARELATVREVRIEALVEEPRAAAAANAVRRAHPYEMPAIDIYRLESTDQGRSGLGAAGDLKEQVTLADFAARVKQALGISTLRVAGSLDSMVRRVGVCGGAGHDLITAAEKSGCDVFVTGELRHNSYYDYDIALIEAGHYHTEKCFVDIMCDALRMSEPVIQYKVDVRGFHELGRPYIDY
ncbi:MAG: Nif3-like dinuclear metal center hexameric protein [Clostridia bacterium]|nr:Nif3-like dinuclear metal center hexameric protein [Clostridia bacterium]